MNPLTLHSLVSEFEQREFSPGGVEAARFETVRLLVVGGQGCHTRSAGPSLVTGTVSRKHWMTEAEEWCVTQLA